MTSEKTEVATAESMPNDIKGLLQTDTFRAQVATAIPKHCSPDRMIRVALSALKANPKLGRCKKESFFGCLLSLSQWGLEPDGRRAHLIPYGDQCTLIIDYKGYVELCYRNGITKSIHAEVVHEGDIFEYSLGEVTKHTPWDWRTDSGRPPKQGEILGAFCVVELDGGVKKTEIMSKAEIEKIRKRSKSGNNGPWKTDWAEMAKKTVFRRCQKWLPLSADILRNAMDEDDKDYQNPPSLTKSKLASLTEEPEIIEGEVVEPNNDVVADLEAGLKACKTAKEVDECFARLVKAAKPDTPLEAHMVTLAEARKQELES